MIDSSIFHRIFTVFPCSHRFNLSKMDKLYLESARILREVDAKRDSFRNLIFQSSYKNKKQLYKLCFETLKRRTILRGIVSDCPQLEQTVQFAEDPHLLSILLYEYLYGVNGLRQCRNHAWRKAVEQHESQLAASKNRLDSRFTNAKGPDDDQNGLGSIPRYVRVNTLKCKMDETISWLEEDGCVKVDVDGESRKSYLKRIRAFKDYEFCVDPILDNLLVFAPGTDLHDYRLVVDGRLVLQDKSSCLSATCLNPSPNDVVMDVCAAPGMKTSHLAALMENDGYIFAIDKDRRRVETMHSLLEQKGVTCAEVMCQDFLAMDLSEKRFKKVSHILLDPPCSGSGIVNRGDSWMDGGPDNAAIDERRINGLGNLQAMMLKRVLSSQLANLRRVVYSTCSIHQRENEVVIQEALETAQANGFQLVNALEAWQHRGSKDYEFGHLCLRASPKKDGTNGFFVCVFER